jgi:ligand-binding sensor domain-containing protein
MNLQQQFRRWRYIRGGYLGRLVSAQPRKVLRAEDGSLRAIHLPLWIRTILTDVYNHVWVDTTPEASFEVDGKMTPFTPPSLLHFDGAAWQCIEAFKYGEDGDGFVSAFWHNDVLWGVGFKGLAKYQERQRVAVATPQQGQFVALCQDRQSQLWGLTLTGDLWTSPDGNAWNLAQAHRPTHVLRIIGAHPSNGIWLSERVIGSRRGSSSSLWHCAAANEAIIVTSLPKPVQPTCVFVDSLGQLWIGTTDAGVFIFDGTNWKQFARVTYETPNGLPSRNITAIVEDALHRIWIMTDNGIAVFDGNKWFTVYVLIEDYQTKSVCVWKEYSRLVTTGIESDGRVWFGTRHGDVGWLDTTQPIEQLNIIPMSLEPKLIPYPG